MPESKVVIARNPSRFIEIEEEPLLLLFPDHHSCCCTGYYILFKRISYILFKFKIRSKIQCLSFLDRSIPAGKNRTTVGWKHNFVQKKLFVKY